MEIKPSNVLRVAAELLLKNHTEGNPANRFGCCGALAEACYQAGLPEQRYGYRFGKLHETASNYLGMFCRECLDSFYWWVNPIYRPETEARMNALLFAAAIAESEGD